jgi:hypothetical protein
VKIQLFRCMASCLLVSSYWRIWRAWCLHLQGTRRSGLCMASCLLVSSYWRIGRAWCLHFRVQDVLVCVYGAQDILQTTSNHLPFHTASHRRSLDFYYNKLTHKTNQPVSTQQPAAFFARWLPSPLHWNGQFVL